MAGLIHLVLKMLERSEAKVSRYVLRGVGRSNAAYLLGAPELHVLSLVGKKHELSMNQWATSRPVLIFCPVRRYGTLYSKKTL